MLITRLKQRRYPIPKFYPIIFVYGRGGPGDLVRDFGTADERDPYVGWNTGHRYNDPDGWIKFRNTELNFEGLVLRLVKDFSYYEASNDEELADFKSYLGMRPLRPVKHPSRAAAKRHRTKPCGLSVIMNTTKST